MLCRGLVRLRTVRSRQHGESRRPALQARPLIATTTLLLAICSYAQPPGSASPSRASAASLPQHIRDDLAWREAALQQPGVVAAGLNEVADLGNGLRVRPLAVLEDSRCPQDVECIWAGRLRLRVAIDGAGEREVDLGGESGPTARGLFALVAALPGPWAELPQGAVPYRFGFRRKEAPEVQGSLPDAVPPAIGP